MAAATLSRNYVYELVIDPSVDIDQSGNMHLQVQEFKVVKPIPTGIEFEIVLRISICTRIGW